ncbi:MAG: ABC transporter substrate-binding protein [Pseudomonadota bacterium]
MSRNTRFILLWLGLALAAPGHLVAAPPITIGLDADMSSVAAQGGQAIMRGALIAIHELNQQGGVLGRNLELKVKDHRGNPARGIDNIEEFAAEPNIVAVLGGVHTPVALRELPTIHRHGLPYLDPWAAGTPIIDNGYEPNFAFRLSVRDEHAGAFLIDQALKRGYARPALLLEQTPWGQSNQKAITAALNERSRPQPVVEWFYWGTDDLNAQLESFRRANADVIIFVGNAPEGAILVKTLAASPESTRLPVISHWGVAGGDFPSMTGPDLEKVQFSFLQTFSFFSAYDQGHADRVLGHYCRLFETCNAADIMASVGVAHAYDLVHILARAIDLADSTDRLHVREALERVQNYSGLTRHFEQPFTRTKHDALDATSFQLGQFDKNGTIRPIGSVRQPDS